MTLCPISLRIWLPNTGTEHTCCTKLAFSKEGRSSQDLLKMQQPYLADFKLLNILRVTDFSTSRTAYLFMMYISKERLLHLRTASGSSKIFRAQICLVRKLLRHHMPMVLSTKKGKFPLHFNASYLGAL